MGGRIRIDSLNSEGFLFEERVNLWDDKVFFFSLVGVKFNALNILDTLLESSLTRVSLC